MPRELYKDATWKVGGAAGIKNVREAGAILKVHELLEGALVECRV
jgi:hypothetical protein